MIGAGEPLMKHHVLLLLACVITLATSTCFRPKMHCAPCVTNAQCAENLQCIGDLCVANDTNECRDDAGSSSDAVAEDVSESPAPDSDSSTTDATDSSTEVAGNQCIDRCCIGASSCLDLVPRVRQGLLLWADRTSMGRPGFPLETWLDRSVGAHHLMSLNPDSPPRVGIDPSGPIADIDDTRMVLATEAGPSLRLGIDDFTILARVRCDVEAQLAPVFQKRSIERPRTGILMFCNHDGAGVLVGPPTAPNRAFLQIIDDKYLPIAASGMIASQRTDLPGKLHLLAARRVEGHRLQLRVDGALEGEIEIPPSVDLKDELPLFVGAFASNPPTFRTTFRGAIAAIVMIRGPLTDSELEALEGFLIRTGGEGAPPL